MALFNMFRKKQSQEIEPPKTKMVGLPMYFGPDVPLPRIFGRLERLYMWMDQKEGTAGTEKVQEIRAEIDRLRYQLAGKGFPLVNSHKELMDARRNI